jgi:hypothetical protein
VVEQKDTWRSNIYVNVLTTPGELNAGEGPSMDCWLPMCNQDSAQNPTPRLVDILYTEPKQHHAVGLLQRCSAPRSGIKNVASFWCRSPQAPRERSLHNTGRLSAHGSHLSFITDIHMRFSLLVSREGTCDYYLTMTTCTSTTYSRMVDPVVRD